MSLPYFSLPHNLFRELYLHKRHLKYICRCWFYIARQCTFVCVTPFGSRDFIRSGNIGLRKAHEPQKARLKRATRGTALYGSFLMGKRCLKIKETIPPGTNARRPIERE